jgi:hypothetical protein
VNVPRSALVLSAAVALAAPATVLAKGGGQPAPAPQPIPAPSAKSCATLASDVPPQVRNAGSDKPIGLSWSVANCSSASETVTVKATPSTRRVEGNQVVDCAGTTFSVGTVTLKPGEKRSVKIDAPRDACYVPSTSLNVTYDAAATDAAGAVLATTSNMITLTRNGP